MVYLKSCEFVNCQSLVNVTFEFKPGLNVIVAPNNTGKSIFGKLNKLSGNPKAYSKEDRNDLITKGQSEAIVRYIFSDDSASLMVLRTDKPPAYFYTPDVYSEKPEVSPEPFPEHIEKMSFLLDRETNFYANMIDIERTRFLSSGMNKESSSILKMYSEDERIEQSLVVMADRDVEYVDYIEKLMVKSYTLKGELDSIPKVNINKMIRKKERLSMATEALKALVDVGVLIDKAVIPKDMQMTKDLLDFVELAQEMVTLMPKEVIAEQKVIDVTVIDDCLRLMEMPVPSDITKEYKIMMEEVSASLELLDKLSFFSDYKLEKTIPLVISEEISGILGILDTIDDHKDIVEERIDISNELEDIRRQMAEHGTEFPCPIYGRIQHIGEVCLPYSD